VLLGERVSTNRIDIADRVRHALIDAAIRAYEDAGVRGLCEEGRWEVAVDAMRSLDLGSAVQSAGTAVPPDARR
jgi:hypothetical protein